MVSTIFIITRAVFFLLVVRGEIELRCPAASAAASRRAASRRRWRSRPGRRWWRRNVTVVALDAKRSRDALHCRLKLRNRNVFRQHLEVRRRRGTAARTACSTAALRRRGLILCGRAGLLHEYH
jgi:hypothetical protein